MKRNNDLIKIFVPLNTFIKKLKSKLWHLSSEENFDDFSIKTISIFQNPIYADNNIIDVEYVNHGFDNINERLIPFHFSYPDFNGNNKNVYLITGFKDGSKFGMSSLINYLFSSEEISRFKKPIYGILDNKNSIDYLSNIGLTYKSLKMINTFIDRKSFESIDKFKENVKSETFQEFENKIMNYYISNVERVKKKYNVDKHAVYLNTKYMFLLFIISINLKNIKFVHIDSKKKPFQVNGISFFDRYYRGNSFLIMKQEN